MNKIIKIETAVGIILIIAAIISGVIIFENRENKIQENQEINETESIRLDKMIIEKNIENNEVTCNDQKDIFVDVEIKDNMNYLVLCEKNKKNILDEGKLNAPKNDVTNFIIFKNPRLSPKKNYIIVDVNGYEGSISWVYDVKTKEKVNHEFSGVGNIGFTDDERYFYKCGHLMNEKWGQVKKVPDFSIAFDYFGGITMPNETYEKNDEFESISCFYNKESNQIEFMFKDMTVKDEDMAIKKEVFQLRNN
jgi:hypothetical protein